ALGRPPAGRRAGVRVAPPPDDGDLVVPGLDDRGPPLERRSVLHPARRVRLVDERDGRVLGEGLDEGRLPGAESLLVLRELRCRRLGWVPDPARRPVDAVLEPAGVAPEDDGRAYVVRRPAEHGDRQEARIRLL